MYVPHMYCLPCLSELLSLCLVCAPYPLVVGCDQLYSPPFLIPPPPLPSPGGDKMTGVQRSQSASYMSGMHKPKPEYHHSHSAEESGGGRPIQLLSNYWTLHGSHAGGGGGTIELESDVLTGFGSTKQPEMGASKLESTSAVEEPSELQDASAVDVQKSAIFSRVHLFDPISEHATFRMRREEAQPDTHSPLPSEDYTPSKGQAGQYHQHHLVGSETVRQRETAASGGGGGSSPKEEGEWRVACCLGP